MITLVLFITQLAFPLNILFSIPVVYFVCATLDSTHFSIFLFAQSATTFPSTVTSHISIDILANSLPHAVFPPILFSNFQFHYMPLESLCFHFLFIIATAHIDVFSIPTLLLTVEG